MAKGPVSIGGIELDAEVDDTITASSDIPQYPVESGFDVSDTITLQPFEVSINGYISDTPLTWAASHGVYAGRAAAIAEQLFDLWETRALTKVVTMDKMYTEMAIVNMSIKNSEDLGGGKSVSITARKVYVTNRTVVSVPKSSKKSGSTKKNRGKAKTSSSSKKSSSSPKSTNSLDKYSFKDQQADKMNAGYKPKAKTWAKKLEDSSGIYSGLFG